MHPTADRPSVIPNDGGPRAWAVTAARACKTGHAARVPQGPRPRQREALLRQGERRAGERPRDPDSARRDGFLGGG